MTASESPEFSTHLRPKGGAQSKSVSGGAMLRRLLAPTTLRDAMGQALEDKRFPDRSISRNGPAPKRRW